MNLSIKDWMENYQIVIYFLVVIFATIVTFLLPNTPYFEYMITPALALMLFVTFLQVPILELKQAFKRVDFISALIFSNFIIIPIIVFFLIQFLPDNPLLKLGVLFVLLSPCIDYVITFSHLAKADSKILLASTPILLILQMILLPIYLTIFLDQKLVSYIEIAPFIEAFIFLILIPFSLAAILQRYSKRDKKKVDFINKLGFLAVPSTAFVLFVVVLAVFPKLSLAIDEVLYVIPIYVVFAILAPFLGFIVGSIFNLQVKEKIAISFSSSTRNSLVILPLALAIPNALPLVPAVIVSQTFVELIFEIIYIFIFLRIFKKYNLFN